MEASGNNKESSVAETNSTDEQSHNTDTLEAVSNKARAAAKAREAKANKKSQIESIQERLNELHTMFATHVDTLRETAAPAAQTASPVPTPLPTKKVAEVNISDDEIPLPRKKRRIKFDSDSDDDDNMLEYRLFRRLTRRQSLASLLAQTLNSPAPAPILGRPLPTIAEDEAPATVQTSATTKIQPNKGRVPSQASGRTQHQQFRIRPNLSNMIA